MTSVFKFLFLVRSDIDFAFFIFIGYFLNALDGPDDDIMQKDVDDIQLSGKNIIWIS